MAKSDVLRAIAIVVGLMLLRLVFIVDESHIIVYIVGGFVILYKLIQFAEKRRSQKAVSQSETTKKRAALIPMKHEGKTYAYLEDMPPNVRKCYDNFVAALNKAHLDGLEMLLSNIEREDVVQRLQQAAEIKSAGLISDEEFAATKKQLLTYRD